MTATPRRVDWWAGLGDVTVAVECGPSTHTLTWSRGVLHACDHPDLERERTLTALGGAPARCVAIVDAWQAHQDDLGLLVLAPRGPADTGGDDGTTAMYMTPGQYRRRHRMMIAPQPATRGWIGSPGSAAPAGLYDDEPPPDGVEVLLGLGGGLAERAVAGVIGTWAERVASEDERVAAARPRLHAALYGRLLPSLRSFVGDPQLPVRVVLTGPDEPRRLWRDGATVVAELPFAWLAEVWCRGLATLLGRFVLAVTPDGERWSIGGVGPELGEMRTATLDW